MNLNIIVNNNAMLVFFANAMNHNVMLITWQRLLLSSTTTSLWWWITACRVLWMFIDTRSATELYCVLMKIYCIVICLLEELYFLIYQLVIWQLSGLGLSECYVSTVRWLNAYQHHQRLFTYLINIPYL